MCVGHHVLVAKMSELCLGCTTFVATAVPHDECGTDGLPLTPNSVKILGLAQELKALKHVNICQYVDFQCGKHDRIFSVSECYVDTIYKRILDPPDLVLGEWHNLCLKYIVGCLNGLEFLNERKIVHHSLEPKNIFITSKNIPKIGGFGLHHMSDGGNLIDSPIGNPKYHPPEQIIMLHMAAGASCGNKKFDVWALAFILLELIHKEFVWNSENNLSVVSHILQLCLLNSAQKVVEVLCQTFSQQHVLSSVGQTMQQIKFVLDNSFAIDQSKRLTASQLLKGVSVKHLESLVDGMNGSSSSRSFETDYEVDVNPMNDLEADELWHLWKLAGGDMPACVSKSDSAAPAIQTLPCFVTLQGDMLGMEPSADTFFDPAVTFLSLDAIEKRMVITPETAAFFYPLLEKSDERHQHEARKLPLLIRENDFDYQVYRLALFKRLLLGYPFVRDFLWKEARVDIPVFFRGHVWACLLDVQGDIDDEYVHIDKETPFLADRQIAVDIPRCHQYNTILSSPAAHEKLKRVLKAWLSSHQHLTYWQGLDSLCAVFLHLNFNNEARAYKSLSLFIDKYLYNFFLKDNSAIIQEYLIVFAHLVAFHDPDLSCHMSDIGFIPDLYAIPWFLTMFAHVFPLHKIVHLWDTLLLGNSSFPLCIGVALLLQVREELLKSDFNECILLFSDFPEVDIDSVVHKSIQIFCHTPKSSTFRVHAKHDAKSNQRQTSYYSDDYNHSPKSELSITPVPLEELKKEVCCRISAEDLIQLSELRGSSSSKTPAKPLKSSKPRICVIDIRQREEYSRGTIPDSVSFPYPGHKPAAALIPTINQQKAKVVVIVGIQQSRDDREFARELLGAGIKGVCVLHGGIEVLKPVGILTVPSLD